MNKYKWLPDVDPKIYLLSSIPLGLASLAGLGRLVLLMGKRKGETQSGWSMLSTTQKVRSVGLVVIPLALSFACQGAYAGF